MKEILKKGVNQIKENKWIHYLIIIIIGIILSIPLAKIQIRDTHDGTLHMLRILGTEDTLKIGQIPPLINQNYCNGVGYAMNLFYQPIVTYIPLLIKLFTPSYMTALKIFGGICIVFSGITMYKFAYIVTKKRAVALFSAIFYLIAPYKLANVYKRFAIGEFTALAFMPLVFLGLYNLFNQDGKKHYYITIGAAGLMLSHTVTTLYTAIFAIIYILFNIRKIKQREIIKKCIINIIFILLISMLFWLPLLEATSACDYAIMDDEIMRTNGDFVAYNTISFSQFFKDKGEENGTTFLIGIPTIALLILTIFVYKKIDNSYNEIYLINLIFALISIFMTSRFFPWEIMPGILCKLQYPWRMMGFFNFFTSFICGVNLYIILRQLIKRDNIRLIVSIIFVVLSVIYSNKIMSSFYATDTNLDNTYETAILKNKKISHMSINRDYMPVRAITLQKSYVMQRKDTTYILEGSANIINENKVNLTDNIEIENITKDTTLEFPYYYYVGYKVTIEMSDGSVKDIKPIESKNGYLSCVIDENIDRAIIKVEYVGTTITYVSYIISLISLIGFIIYVRYEVKKGEKNVKN